MFVFIHQCNAYLEVWEVLFCFCKTALAVTVSCLRLHLLPVSSILNAACLCVAVKWGALKSKKEERKIAWLHITAVCCNSLTLIRSWNDTYAQTRWIRFFFFFKFLFSPQIKWYQLQLTVLCFHVTCVVDWLVATLTGDTDVDCWTVRICWPSATFTGSATDFWEAPEVGEATDTTVTWQEQTSGMSCENFTWLNKDPSWMAI